MTSDSKHTPIDSKHTSTVSGQSADVGTPEPKQTITVATNTILRQLLTQSTFTYAFQIIASSSDTTPLVEYNLCNTADGILTALGKIMVGCGKPASIDLIINKIPYEVGFIHAQVDLRWIRNMTAAFVVILFREGAAGEANQVLTETKIQEACRKA